LSESRLAPAWAALRAQERTALIPYLTAGYPSAEASLAALRVADEVADIIEVGVPFSDPLADGPTIQRSAFDALRQGMTLAGTLALIERARLARIADSTPASLPAGRSVSSTPATPRASASRRKRSRP
jgi:tryptophan synthase alpha subunit